jgi:hypothetical protein
MSIPSQYLVSSMKLFNMPNPWNLYFLFEKITNTELDGQPYM